MQFMTAGQALNLGKDSYFEVNYNCFQQSQTYSKNYNTLTEVIQRLKVCHSIVPKFTPKVCNFLNY